MSASELNSLERVVRKNAGLFRSKWDEYFND